VVLVSHNQKFDNNSSKSFGMIPAHVTPTLILRLRSSSRWSSNDTAPMVGTASCPNSSHTVIRCGNGVSRPRRCKRLASSPLHHFAGVSSCRVSLLRFPSQSMMASPLDRVSPFSCRKLGRSILSESESPRPCCRSHLGVQGS
jgi:hypothetical protein